MGATTMRKITSLIEQLKHHSHTVDHLRSVDFVSGDYFGWDKKLRTITYNTHEPEAQAYTLHEYGHALLDHDSYTRDVSLVLMEREAWDQAMSIAPDFSTTINPELVESALDTYRDWLHARSLCPDCHSTGIQDAPYRYRCLSCDQQWHVNEARTCELRRYKTKNSSIL